MEASNAAAGILAPQAETDKLNDFFIFVRRAATYIQILRMSCLMKPALILNLSRTERFISHLLKRMLRKFAKDMNGRKSGIES